MKNLNLFSRKAKPVRRNICPIIAGLRTVMREESFRRSCKLHRRKANGEGRSVLDNDSYKFCLECRGSIVPKEVEFI